MGINNGTLYVISAPSGAGKSTLVKAITDLDKQVHESVSFTTRPMRPGERDGLDYHFVAKDYFKKIIEEEGFLEYAEVFGNYYGTSKHMIQAKLELGYDVILIIDWQGAQQVRRIFPEAKTIYVMPPSLNALQHRLEVREQDPTEVIRDRMSKAKAEISHYDEYDYVIVNDDLVVATAQLHAIIMAGRVTLVKQLPQLKPLLADIL